MSVPSWSSPPADWRPALQRFARLVQPLDVTWMLVGSAATAVRGVALVPGDLDILVSAPHEVAAIAEVMPSVESDEGNADPRAFLSSMARPVLEFADGTWFFGRWRLNDVEVEVAHIRCAPPECERLLETTGDEVWRRRELVNVFDTQVPIVPLEVQIATMVSRGQHDRLSLVVRRVPKSRLREDLLRNALHDRGFDDVEALAAALLG